MYKNIINFLWIALFFTSIETKASESSDISAIMKAEIEYESYKACEDIKETLPQYLQSIKYENLPQETKDELTLFVLANAIGMVKDEVKAITRQKKAQYEKRNKKVML